MRILHRLRAAVGDDRGSVELELAIVAPALLLLLFGALQVYQVDQARSLALAAAQQGVDSARAYGATDEAGSQRAYRFLDRVNSGDLQGASVSVVSDGTQVTVTVTGTPRTVFGGWISVNRSWTGAKERFTTGDSP